MAEGRETRKRSGRWPTAGLPPGGSYARLRGAEAWAAIVPAAVLLYVLSIGPAIAIWPRSPPGPVMVFYAPLVWLIWNTPLREPFEWYADLWDRPPPAKPGP